MGVPPAEVQRVPPEHAHGDGAVVAQPEADHAPAVVEELGELAQAVRKGTQEEQLHELGDVLAWLASLANQIDLSLDDAFQRYVTDPP